ncbi:MAG: hypothetical protein R3B60_04370 [Candidatus Paceibacterota bacterium]
MSPQQDAANEAWKFVEKVNDVILFPLIALLSGIAFLVFIYGAAIFIFNGASEQARDKGKKHMTYGIIGLVIMASAYAILSIAVNTFGLGQTLDCTKDPTAAQCNTVFNPVNNNTNNTNNSNPNTGP